MKVCSVEFESRRVEEKEFEKERRDKILENLTDYVRS